MACCERRWYSWRGSLGACHMVRAPTATTVDPCGFSAWIAGALISRWIVHPATVQVLFQVFEKHHHGRDIPAPWCMISVRDYGLLPCEIAKSDRWVPAPSR